MQRLRRVLRAKKQTYWFLSLLFILILTSLVIPLNLTAHETVKRDAAFKFHHVFPLQGWFKASEPAPEYSEKDDSTMAKISESSVVMPILRYQKEFFIQRHQGGRHTQMAAGVALWQTDQAYLVLSVKIRPLHTAE